jgi:prolipoprotein diacylglyceryl transferase
MLDKLINFWTRTPIALRTDRIIVVWFGVIVGGVAAFAIPVILLFSYEMTSMTYVRFFYSFFFWWPIFAILGSILLFHDFWFKLGGMIKKIFSGEKYSWRRPGAVFYGGFLGSLILIIILAVRYKLSILYALDFVFTLIPFFHGISRLACLNFGCCYGKPCAASTPLKVQYRHPDSEPVRHGIPEGQSLHPVQLYEMACCIFIGCFLFSLAGKLGEGKIFAVYLVSYGIARFFLEFIRDNTHEKVLFGRISIWQALSLCFIAGGIVLLFALPGTKPVRWQNPQIDPDYSHIFLLAAWNACALGLVFGIHFRKREEAL